MRLREQICHFFLASSKEKTHNAESDEILWVERWRCRRSRDALRGGCGEVYVARTLVSATTVLREAVRVGKLSLPISRCWRCELYACVCSLERCSVALLAILPRGKAMGGRREPEWWVSEEGVNSND